MPKPTTAKHQKKIKDFLKAKGHSAAKIDKLKLNTEEEVVTSVIELHGLTVTQYKGCGVG